MSLLLDLAIWCATAAACVGGWAFLCRRLLPLDDSPDEIHFLTTSDGWRIAMGRYRAAPSEGEAHGTPVVLCHGIGANRFNLDFAPGRSLARHLAAQGFDCWVPELRGVGRSERPKLLGLRRYTWTFDTLVEQDVPAIIRRVREATGAAGVHWVGHSLGGMLIYAHLARTRSADVHSVCTIASPGDLRDTASLNKLVLRAIKALSWWPALHLRTLGGVFAPLAGLLVALPSARALVNPDNMEGWVARRSFAHLGEDIGLRLLRQFSSWALDPQGSIRSADGEFDYIAELRAVEQPACFMAGEADFTATPSGVRSAYEQWGGPKAMRVFGRQQGETIDYGHGDLLVGTHAPREIYPAVSTWLSEGIQRAEQAETTPPPEATDTKAVEQAASKAPEEQAASKAPEGELAAAPQAKPKARSKAKRSASKKKARSDTKAGDTKGSAGLSKGA